MAVSARRLVGREAETEALLGLLTTREHLPAVAVVVGEPGIGKTTLWLAARDAADAAGYRLLSCRSSEAEAGFSFAGLTDLLGDVVDEALSDLPPGRKRSSERLAYQSGRTWCYKPR